MQDHFQKNAIDVKNLKINKNLKDSILSIVYAMNVFYRKGALNMNQKIKLVVKNDFNKINLEQLNSDHNEIVSDGDGYILVYRNKKEKSYYIMSNGFTNEEGVYASQLICNAIINDSSEFNNRGKNKSE